MIRVGSSTHLIFSFEEKMRLHSDSGLEILFYEKCKIFQNWVVKMEGNPFPKIKNERNWTF